MRKFVLLTAILFFFLYSKAQIGFRIYKEAAYYPISGPIVKGKISMIPDQDYFMFKADSNGEKQQIYLSDVKSVIFKKDTLISLYYFDGKENKFYLGKLVMDGKTKLYSKTDPRVNTYPEQEFNRNYNAQAPQSNNNSPFVMSNTAHYSVITGYYFGTDTPQETIKLDKTNFKEQMSNVLAEYPDMVEQIQNEKLNMKHFDAILKEYYSRKGITPGK